MQKNKYILLVALTIGFVTLSFSQHTRYAIRNGIGIQGGLTQYDINTNNFTTHKSDGWTGALNATVDLPHKWYTVSYYMMISDNKVEIDGLNTQVSSIVKPMEYKLMAVQLGFNFHLKLIDQFLMLEAGPQLQYNSKLELQDKAFENYIVSGFNTLKASDIEDINNFNINGVLGVSAGFGAFRLRAQYIYGFLNMLNKLNDLDSNLRLNQKFKGHQSMFAFTAMIVF